MQLRNTEMIADFELLQHILVRVKYRECIFGTIQGFARMCVQLCIIAKVKYRSCDGDNSTGNESRSITQKIPEIRMYLGTAPAISAMKIRCISLCSVSVHCLTLDIPFLK